MLKYFGILFLFHEIIFFQGVKYELLYNQNFESKQMTVWSSSHKWRFWLSIPSFCYQLTLGFPHQHLHWCFGLFICNYTITCLQISIKIIFLCGCSAGPFGYVVVTLVPGSNFSQKPSFMIQNTNLHFILSPADTIKSLQPPIFCWFLWHFCIIFCRFYLLHYYISLCCGFDLKFYIKLKCSVNPINMCMVLYILPQPNNIVKKKSS